MVAGLSGQNLNPVLLLNVGMERGRSNASVQILNQRTEDSSALASALNLNNAKMFVQVIDDMQQLLRILKSSVINIPCITP